MKNPVFDKFAKQPQTWLKSAAKELHLQSCILENKW